jgi:lipooligosaccharide transport system permease protein
LSTEQSAGTRTGHLVKPTGGGIRSMLTYNLIADRRYVKVSLLSQLLTPVLYLLSLGLGLGSVVNAHGGAGTLGTSYLSFIAPALIAATALQVAAGDAAYPILYGGFKYQRIYFGISATPMPAGQLARAVLTWISCKASAAAVIYLAIVACFGGIRSPGALLCVPVATLGAMALAAPIAALSATVQDEGGSFNLIFRFLVTPMVLFSGIFYPISALPEWGQALAWLSPLWHAAELARWVSLGPLHLSSGVGSLSGGLVLAHLAFLTVLTVAGVRLTIWRFGVRLYR